MVPAYRDKGIILGALVATVSITAAAVADSYGFSYFSKSSHSCVYIEAD